MSRHKSSSFDSFLEERGIKDELLAKFGMLCCSFCAASSAKRTFFVSSQVCPAYICEKCIDAAARNLRKARTKKEKKKP